MCSVACNMSSQISRRDLGGLEVAWELGSRDEKVYKTLLMDKSFLFVGLFI